MGSVLSTSLAPRVELSEQVTCSSACGNSVATYRCQINRAEGQTTFFTVEDFASLGPRHRAAALEIEPYWRSATPAHRRYVGCERCLTTGARRMFTHVPGGWKECPIGTFVVDVPYEPLRLTDFAACG